MAACQSCGKPTSRFGSHCDECYEAYQAELRAAAPPSAPAPVLEAPANGVVITDIQLSFGRWVGLTFTLLFAAIPAAILFGVLWGVVLVVTGRLGTP